MSTNPMAHERTTDLEITSMIRSSVSSVMSALKYRTETSDSDFARKVRGYDFRNIHDSNLKLILGNLRNGAHHESELPCAFAVIDETIRRRLGIWRLFDRNSTAEPLDEYQQITDKIIQYLSDSESNPSEDHGVDNDSFEVALHSILPKTEMDSLDLTIIKTMVYVNMRRLRESSPNILLPAKFYQAVASKDTTDSFSFRPTDEQLLTGHLLIQGKVVEMFSGEGKTIAGLFPTIIHATMGRPVHVITSNDYLAARDHEILAPIHDSLGITNAVVLGYMNDKERRKAYDTQIVYSSLREIGFDFLRDNLRHSLRDKVRPRMDVAIVDEADHALIDDASTPIIISGGRSSNTRHIRKIRTAVETLTSRQRRTVSLLERSILNSVNSKKLPELLATLMLADPSSAILTNYLSANKRLSRKVHSIANAHDVLNLDLSMTKELDYVVNSQKEFFSLTESGQHFVETFLGSILNTHDLESRLTIAENDQKTPLEKNRRLRERLNRDIHKRYGLMNQLYQMLRAYILLERNVDYIVSDHEVVLVDPHTGRRKPESRYQHGLQSSIEAKERVPIRKEPKILGEVSVRGLLGQYKTLCGMTGTGMHAKAQFRSVYGLDTVPIPLTRKSLRHDFPTRLYQTDEDKLSALVEEVRFWNLVGRPVLIGTLSVNQSQKISNLLRQTGVQHSVLNAMNSAEEAQIVKFSGRLGAVTVATNIAGRGTDILLQPGLDLSIINQYSCLIAHHVSLNTPIIIDCRSEHEASMLEQAITKHIDSKLVIRSGYNLEILSTKRTTQCSKQPVHLRFGLGLHVIGTEVNQSLRTDDQLRGRSGRQGEFGSSEFVFSLEDKALSGFTNTWAPNQSNTKPDKGERNYYEHPSISQNLNRFKSTLEQEHIGQHNRILDYAKVTDNMTMCYYRNRNHFVGSNDLSGHIIESIKRISNSIVDNHLSVTKMYEYESNFCALMDEMKLDYKVDCSQLYGQGIHAVAQELEHLLVNTYNTHRSAFGHNTNDIERRLLLETIDDQWSTYLADNQDKVLSSQVYSLGHRSAITDFMIDRGKAFDNLIQDATDSFLIAFLKLDPPKTETQPELEADIIADIERILTSQDAVPGVHEMNIPLPRKTRPAPLDGSLTNQDDIRQVTSK